MRDAFLSFTYRNLGSGPGCAGEEARGERRRKTGERESGNELVRGDGRGKGEEGSNGM